MLAPHHDRENWVHAQQLASRQNTKPARSLYPKTPSRFPQNDENAPTVFRGKDAVSQAGKFEMKGNISAKGNTAQRPLRTPLDKQSRAPLGNKTTNAKARQVQSQAVKDRVREIEEKQVRLTSTQKQRQNSRQLSSKTAVQDATPARSWEEEEEPEYAPPKDDPIPYESDVLPREGLTFEGLKKENLLRGYYEHYFNPIDKSGSSRQDKELEKEIQAAFERAFKENDHQMGELSWNPLDIDDPQTSQARASSSSSRRESSGGDKFKSAPSKPSILSSKRAATALAGPDDRQRPTGTRVTQQRTVRRPLSNILSTQRTSKPNELRASQTDKSTAELASRTTLGYTRGRAASSMIHSDGQKNAAQIQRSKGCNLPTNQTERGAALRRAQSAETDSREHPQSRPCPQFLSIFQDDEVDDLPSSSKPSALEDDDETSEFELKLEL